MLPRYGKLLGKLLRLLGLVNVLDAKFLNQPMNLALRKHCLGPDFVEDDHGSHLELPEQTEIAVANAPDTESNAILMKSLMDSVKKLTQDMQSLRQETQDLHKLLHVPPARHLPPSLSTMTNAATTTATTNAATSNVTLPELRAMTTLASKVDHWVDQLVYFPPRTAIPIEMTFTQQMLVYLQRQPPVNLRVS